jgi:hypothetical protein
MANNSFLPRTTGAGLLGPAVLALLWLFSSASAAPAPSGSGRVEQWLSRMADHYELNPELKDTKGSGWKPYNRAKWFYEQRLLNGVPPAPDARWNAWEAKREVERRSGITPRSTWFSLGPANFSGRILDIEFHPSDPNIVYVGSASGGLWKSTDNGSSWVALEDELPVLAIGAVCVLPSDPDIVLIGTGEGAAGDVHGVGILKSTDGGATWGTTDFVRPVEGQHGFHVMEVNPTTGTILAGTTDGLWRSTDDGDTWIDVRPGDDWYDVKWKPGDPMRVYTVKGSASTGNNVKVSTDDGVMWTVAGSGQPPGFSVGKSKIAVSPDEPSWIYALYSENSASGNTVGVYRSTNDGANWTLQNNTTNIAGGQGWYNLTLAADPNDATRVIAGGVQLFRSTNSGVNWSNISGFVHVDHHAVAYEPGNPDALWVGSDGGVWKSSFDGNPASWADKNSGLVTYQFYDICVNNGPTAYYVMGGTQDNGTDKWSGTTTWSDGLGADGMVCNINPVTGTTVFAEIQFGEHRKNTNSGDSGPWTAIMSGIPGNNQQWVVPTAEDQLAGNHLYTHHSSGGIYRTLNGGTLWENVAGHSATWIDIHPLDGNRVWTTGGATWVTTDDGANWTQAAPFGFLTGTPTKIAAHPADLDGALVTFSSYGAGIAHVALTTDLGATWTDVTGDFPSQPVNAIAVDPQNPTHWYIGTDVGVWRSTNGGANWVPFEAGFPNVVVSDLEIQNVERKLVAGTYGRGAWEIDLTSDPTGVEAGVASSVNILFDRPSPNPITDRTLLRYAAKHEGPVTLGVYDVRGRLVTEVAEFARGDGVIRTTPWFAADVASGVYFAVLRAGDEQKTHKLIVRK